MELNREQIIKALECCQTPLVSDCKVCGYKGKLLDDGTYLGCVNRLMVDAIALIKKLTKENEVITEHCAIQVVKAIKLDNQVQRLTELKEITKADTVREMADRLKARKVSYGNITFKVVPIDDIDRIEKETLEDMG